MIIIIIILMMTSGDGVGCVSAAFLANGPGLLSPTAFIWDYIVCNELQDLLF